MVGEPVRLGDVHVPADAVLTGLELTGGELHVPDAEPPTRLPSPLRGDESGRGRERVPPLCGGLVGVANQANVIAVLVRARRAVHDLVVVRADHILRVIDDLVIAAFRRVPVGGVELAVTGEIVGSCMYIW